MTPETFETRKGVVYANHDGVELAGDLYLPKGAGARPAPALVAVHGGAWIGGSRGAFQYWGPYLAARGTALFAISYRLAQKDRKAFPQAVHDVLAGVRFVRAKAREFNIDPDRIGLLGASAAGIWPRLRRSDARRRRSRAPTRRMRTPRSAPGSRR
jgi:acetyl esterase/lipase